MSMEEKKYTLQMLRQYLLKLDLDEKTVIGINNFFIKNIYCLFGDDNSFVFAKEKNFLEFNFLVSPLDFPFYLINLLLGSATLTSKNYYLVDYFTKRDLSDNYDESFYDNDRYEYNGINYCVKELTKIIPASYLYNINLADLGIIQDRINIFLADNPDFIEKVFFNEEADEEKDDEIILFEGTKKKVLEP